MYKPHPRFLVQNLSKKVRLIHECLRYFIPGSIVISQSKISPHVLSDHQPISSKLFYCSRARPTAVDHHSEFSFCSLIKMMLLLSPMVATFLIFFFTRITAVTLFRVIFQQISAQQSYGAVYCVSSIFAVLTSIE